ncbi:AAA family ATPase [Methylomagnum ishizawai]|uniref:AAA family ATPase n=1 Tax=Methylomagnum ishizawai TaxID=1760988 RepID=UPI001C32EF68|nr:AAA family ATPase [Methylomagnum ishizawai]BBL75056.1 hypothetical protein MishRS11D_21540 [Methylomagnum ishizawai]
MTNLVYENHLKLIEEARRKEQAEARKKAAALAWKNDLDKPGIIYGDFGEVESEPVDWLWPGRIARGKVTLIAGDPGLGKSQITVSLAGIITRGGSWPADGGRCDPGRVLFLSAEDDHADTIKPRLEAVGADITKCLFIRHVQPRDDKGDLQRRAFDLGTDLEMLRKDIQRHGRLDAIFMDTLDSYTGKVDTHKSSDVRALMLALADFAARANVAIIGIMHPNKGQGQTAMNRISGSLAFVAAARAGYMVARDPADPARRYFLPIKNNVGADQTGYAFTIQPVVLPSGIETSRVEWEGWPVSVTADEILSAQADYGDRAALESAKRFLAELLADGPKPVKGLQADAEGNGHSWRTVVRAKEALNIEASKNGTKGGWNWSLPKNANPSEECQKK